jgi:hypothetical protein
VKNDQIQIARANWIIQLGQPIHWQIQPNKAETQRAIPVRSLPTALANWQGSTLVRVDRSWDSNLPISNLMCAVGAQATKGLLQAVTD